MNFYFMVLFHSIKLQTYLSAKRQILHSLFMTIPLIKKVLGGDIKVYQKPTGGMSCYSRSPLTTCLTHNTWGIMKRLGVLSVISL